MSVKSGRPSPARQGRPQVATREALIEAGLALLDERGAAALSMRALASRAGISAMTPYNYFTDKDDLQDAILGHALASFGADDDCDGGWDAQVQGAMHGLRDLLERHPGVVDLFVARTVALTEFRRHLIAVLRDAGLVESAATDALRTLGAYVVGYVVLERANAGHDSFDRGLQMLLRQIREEAA